MSLLADTSKHIPDFSTYLQHGSYVAIYLWFITFDQITPIPEELSLILLGYLAASGLFNPILAGIIALFGFLTADTAYFFLARHGSSLVTKRLKRPLPFITRYRKRLEDNLPKTVFILCFIPRMRFFAPLLVGGGKAPFGKFMMYDATALALFTAVYTTIGFFFSKQLGLSVQEVKSIENIVFFATLAIAAVIVVIIEIRWNRKK